MQMDKTKPEGLSKFQQKIKRFVDETNGEKKFVAILAGKRKDLEKIRSAFHLVLEKFSKDDQKIEWVQKDKSTFELKTLQGTSYFAYQMPTQTLFQSFDQFEHFYSFCPYGDNGMVYTKSLFDVLNKAAKSRIPVHQVAWLD